MAHKQTNLLQFLTHLNILLVRYSFLFVYVPYFRFPQLMLLSCYQELILTFVKDVGEHLLSMDLLSLNLLPHDAQVTVVLPPSQSRAHFYFLSRDVVHISLKSILRMPSTSTSVVKLVQMFAHLLLMHWFELLILLFKWINEADSEFSGATMSLPSLKF